MMKGGCRSDGRFPACSNKDVSPGMNGVITRGALVGVGETQERETIVVMMEGPTPPPSAGTP